MLCLIRQYLAGRTTLGPEAAIGFLNVFFYEWNVNIASRKKLDIHKFNPTEPRCHEKSGSTEAHPNIDFCGIGFCSKPEGTVVFEPKYDTRSSKDFSEQSIAYIHSIGKKPLLHAKVNAVQLMFNNDFNAFTISENKSNSNLEELREKLALFNLTCPDLPCSAWEAMVTSMKSLGLNVTSSQPSCYEDKSLFTEVELGHALQYLSDFFNQLIILVNSETRNIYHVIHPSHVSEAMYSIFIASLDGKLYSTHFKPETQEVAAVKICQCGKKSKGQTVVCVTNSCQCFNREVSCSHCQCRGCGNTFGTRLLTKSDSFRDFCQCTSKQSACTVGAVKARCICVQKKVPCCGKCYCSIQSCKNSKTTEQSKATEVKQSPRKQALKRGAAKITRHSSVAFMGMADIPITERWHWKEEVILRTVIKGLGRKDHIYSAYYKTASVLKNRGIGTRVHSHNRVSAKITNLKL